MFGKKRIKELEYQVRCLESELDMSIAYKYDIVKRYEVLSKEHDLLLKYINKLSEECNFYKNTSTEEGRKLARELLGIGENYNYNYTCKED